MPRRSRDLYNAVKIWEAARATSAATTFFEPIEILHEEFVDGAFGANNPIDEVWTEAGDIWTRKTGDKLEDNISCFVSIGTGIPAFEGVDESLVGMMHTLKSKVTDCESAAERFRRQHHALEGRFFRFNVARGLEAIGLNEITKTGDLIAATRQYLESQSTFLEIEKFQSAFQQRQRKSSIDGKGQCL
jgi:predicted acylesterase/phospholipase RssA